ncbi:MAG TPA: host attachment protein [Burkholderiales bacterium]|nr:host attachment protein [Burkholderiales bacterium]
MTDKTWIVVANSSRARLFERHAAGGELALVREFEHPESRAKGGDLVSDRPGHTATDQGRRTALDPDTEPKRVAQEQFARELGHTLEQGRVQNRYGGLVLVASAPFLGILRGQLSAGVKTQLREAIDKDYTALAERELAAQLGTALAR